MKRKNKEYKYISTNAKLVAAIVPVVLVMILIFFTLTRNEILNLSKDKMALEAANCSEDINKWSEQTINELNIYKSVIEKTSTSDERTLEIMKTSYEFNEAYPYGLYLGDENGTYLDASGWIPEDDFVVTERNWYIEGREHESFAFGEPYVDAMTGDVCVSATAIVNYKPALSVLSADVYWEDAAKLISEVTEGNIESAFCIAGDSRIVMADSNNKIVGKSLNEYKDSKLLNNINDLISENKTGQFKITGETGQYFIDIIKLETSDWYFVTTINWKDILKNIRHLEVLMIIVAAAASLILILLTLRISRNISYIKHKARTDPLTGLLNRNSFKELVVMALSANTEHGVLLIIDLDNFKLINDQLGHPEGDLVLKRFSNVLEGYFNRNKDIVARIGGDEFAVFVGRPIGRDEANAMLKKFISVFHENFDEDYSKQKISVSIGAAYAKDNESKYESLYQSADDILYDVKRNGKDGFKIKRSDTDLE